MFFLNSPRIVKAVVRVTTSRRAPVIVPSLSRYDLTFHVPYGVGLILSISGIVPDVKIFRSTGGRSTLADTSLI